MTYRTRRFFWTLIWLVVLYAIVGFWVLPPIARTQLEKRATAQLGRRVEIGKLRLNPFTLSATLEHVDIRTADGGGSFAGWDRLYVNFEAWSSLSGDWVLGDVELGHFHAAVALDERGAPNFADIVDRFAPERQPLAAPQGPPRPWRIQRLRVADSRIDFTDRSHGPEFHTAVTPIDFSLVEFRTVGAVGAPYRFEATTDAGERIAWNGTLSIAPLASAGELRIENLSLPKYAPYLGARFHGTLESGTLTISGKYELRIAPENRTLALTGGAIQLRDFKLVAPGASEPAIALPSLDITGITVDGFAPSFAAENVQAKGGHIAVHRDADGALDLAALFAAPAPPTPTAFNANLTFGASSAPAKSAAAQSRPPDVRAAEVALEDFQIDWSDAAAPAPAELHLTGVNVTAKQATLAPGAPIPVSVSFGWLPSGTVRLSGAVAVEPLHADLQVDVASLALAPLGPYLAGAMPLALTSGQATAKGRLVVDQPENRPLALTYGGGASLADVHLRGPEQDDVAGFASLDVTDLDLATEPKLTVKTTAVSLREPRVHVVRGADGRINLAAKSPAQAAPVAGTAPGVSVPPAAAATKPSSAAGAPEFVFPSVEISGGELTFADRSVQPEVKLSIAQLGGTLKNLSSSNADAGAVDLHAVIDQASALAIQGALNPLAPEPHADLKVTLQPLSLQPAAPYVRKYAGYELADGQLKLDTHTALAGGKLDMSNHVTLDQFTLGDPVKSPDATNLPVKLGLALLKDTKGRIELDIPVQGSLSDPNFQISGVVSHVLTNTLKKAATSPFALLGAMFGGGGEELGRQDFAPGSIEPTPESAKRLETVARALANRPALQVEIEGGYDAAADTPVLQRRKLDAAVHAKAAGMGDGKGGAEISDLDRSTALRVLFAEAFPTQASAATPGTEPTPEDTAKPAAPPPDTEAKSVAPEEEPEHRSLWRKAVDLATLKHLRDRHAERRAEKKARREAEEQAKQEAERKKAEAAQAAAQPQAPAPALSDAEMEARLLPTFKVTTAELQALAHARAGAVREKLVAGGKIAAERVAVKKNDDPAAAAKLGDHARLHLQ